MTYSWIIKTPGTSQANCETDSGWPAHPGTATRRDGKRKSAIVSLPVRFALNTEHLADYGITGDRPASGNAERVPVT